MPDTSTGTAYALETRAEKLTLHTADVRVREGETDRVEVGRSESSDVVRGSESIRVGGRLKEEYGQSQMVRARRLETTVEGSLAMKGHSHSTILGGAMSETHTGGVFVAAGMSDDMVIGGGMRVTVPADIWVTYLTGMEEKLLTGVADGIFLELYGTHFERDYETSMHSAAVAVFTGTICTTTATGFRQLSHVATHVRNLVPGGGGGGAEGPPAGAPPAPPPAPPAVAGSLVGGATSAGGLVGAAAGAGRAANLAPVFDQAQNVARSVDTARDVQNLQQLTGAAESVGGAVEEGVGVGARLEELSGLAGRPDALDSLRRGLDAVDEADGDPLLDAAHLYVKARNGDVDAKTKLMRMAGAGDEHARRFTKKLFGYGAEDKEVTHMRLLAEGGNQYAVIFLLEIAQEGGSKAADARAALDKLGAAGKVPNLDPSDLLRRALKGDKVAEDHLRELARFDYLGTAVAEYRMLQMQRNYLDVLGEVADKIDEVKQLEAGTQLNQSTLIRLDLQAMADRRESNWDSLMILKNTEEDTLKPFLDGFSEVAGTPPGTTMLEVRSGLVKAIGEAVTAKDADRAQELVGTLDLFDSGLREIVDTAMSEAEDARTPAALPGDFRREETIQALQEARAKAEHRFNVQRAMDDNLDSVGLGAAYDPAVIDQNEADTLAFFDKAIQNIREGNDPQTALGGEISFLQWEVQRGVPGLDSNRNAQKTANYKLARREIYKIMRKTGGVEGFPPPTSPQSSVFSNALARLRALYQRLRDAVSSALRRLRGLGGSAGDPPPAVLEAAADPFPPQVRAESPGRFALDPDGDAAEDLARMEDLTGSGEVVPAGAPPGGGGGPPGGGLVLDPDDGLDLKGYSYPNPDDGSAQGRRQVGFALDPDGGDEARRGEPDADVPSGLGEGEEAPRPQRGRKGTVAGGSPLKNRQGGLQTAPGGAPPSPPPASRPPPAPSGPPPAPSGPPPAPSRPPPAPGPRRSGGILLAPNAEDYVPNPGMGTGSTWSDAEWAEIKKGSSPVNRIKPDFLTTLEGMEGRAYATILRTLEPDPRGANVEEITNLNRGTKRKAADLGDGKTFQFGGGPIDPDVDLRGRSRLRGRKVGFDDQTRVGTYEEGGPRYFVRFADQSEVLSPKSGRQVEGGASPEVATVLTPLGRFEVPPAQDSVRQGERVRVATATDDLHGATLAKDGSLPTQRLEELLDPVLRGGVEGDAYFGYRTASDPELAHVDEKLWIKPRNKRMAGRWKKVEKPIFMDLTLHKHFIARLEAGVDGLGADDARQAKAMLEELRKYADTGSVRPTGASYSEEVLKKLLATQAGELGPGDEINTGSVWHWPSRGDPPTEKMTEFERGQLRDAFDVNRYKGLTPHGTLEPRDLRPARPRKQHDGTFTDYFNSRRAFPFSFDKHQTRGKKGMYTDLIKAQANDMVEPPPSPPPPLAPPPTPPPTPPPRGIDIDEADRGLLEIWSQNRAKMVSINAMANRGNPEYVKYRNQMKALFLWPADLAAAPPPPTPPPSVASPPPTPPPSAAPPPPTPPPGAFDAPTPEAMYRIEGMANGGNRHAIVQRDLLIRHGLWNPVPPRRPAARPPPAVPPNYANHLRERAQDPDFIITVREMANRNDPYFTTMREDMRRLGVWPGSAPPPARPRPTPPTLPPGPTPEAMRRLEESANAGNRHAIEQRELLKSHGMWNPAPPPARPRNLEAPATPPAPPPAPGYSLEDLIGIDIAADRGDLQAIALREQLQNAGRWRDLYAAGAPPTPPRARLMSYDPPTRRASMSGSPPGSYPVPRANGPPPRYPRNWRATDGSVWRASPQDRVDYWFMEDAAMGQGQETFTARRSPDALPPGKAFYREHQGMTLDCGKHALNSYFGGPVLTDGNEFQLLTEDFFAKKLGMTPEAYRALDIGGGADPEIIRHIINDKVQNGQIGPAWSRNFTIQGEGGNPPPMGDPQFQEWVRQTDAFPGDRLMIMNRADYDSMAHFFTFRRHTDGTWQLLDSKGETVLVYNKLSDWLMNRQEAVLTFMHQQPGFTFPGAGYVPPRRPPPKVGA